MINKIHFGDCRKSLHRFIDAGVVVQTCVTSPPYYGLRDYGHEKQIGLESTPEQFIAELVSVFRLVREILADDGTLWINIGDSYARKKGNGTKKKDLIGIPWMLAFALRADGWYLRQDLIWNKPNAMPESVRDRCTNSHEYIFMLSKSAKYYFDSKAVMEKAVGGQSGAALGFKRKASKQAQAVPGQAYGVHRTGREDVSGSGEYRNRRSVWSVPVRAYKGAHSATFPPALIEPCIRAGSRVGEVVLDPFMGSGTTAEVAIELARQFVGCELNREYKPLQDARIKSANARARTTEMSGTKTKKKKQADRLRILICDGNNYIARGFYAVEPLSNKKGEPTNAIKGVVNILLKDIEVFKPDRVIFLFDKKGKKSWRSKLYPEYKRSPERLKQKDDPKYEDLKAQFKPVRRIIKAMGVKTLARAGVEADDFMGTLAVEYGDLGHEVLISTNDKDIASAVNKNVFIATAKDRELLDPAGVKVKYGVHPHQIVEFLMLLGDKVDNIPGVFKCGEGTAAKWLSKYGTIKNLLANIDDFKPPEPKRKTTKPKAMPVVITNLLEAKKNFKLTRKLVTLKTDIPHKIELDDCVLKEPDYELLKKLCTRYELKETHAQILRAAKKWVGQGTAPVTRWRL